jgi:hypothetical protein
MGEVRGQVLWRMVYVESRIRLCIATLDALGQEKKWSPYVEYWRDEEAGLDGTIRTDQRTNYRQNQWEPGS